MFESLVADIIAKYIGEYIKNLSSEQLKINIFSGNVVLKNLEIKGEALQSFKLPLHVQKGIIGTLTLKIPWTNIKSNPVILEIDSISLYAIPQTGFDYNEEEEKKKQIELKRKKLEKFELIRSFKEGTGTDLKQQKQDTFMSSVMSKILNNIQVKIANFHLRYEEIRGGKVYSLGISFGSLSALPVDSNWNVNSSSSSNSSGTDNTTTAGSLFKYIELTNFSIYLDSENKKESISEVLVSGNENTLFVGKMNEMIGTKEQLGKHQYILKPITVVLKIELNRNLDMNIEIPRMKVYCQFHQVSFIIEENQYQSILKLLTTIGNYAQEIRYLKYRPKQRPKQDPKAWWKYVGDVVRESIREKIQQRSWTFIQKRRQNRQEYIQLFKKLQNVDWLEPITEFESKKLLEMEEIQLSFEDIIYFRSLARRELAMETQIADSKKGEFYATLNRSTTSKSFFGGWGSWATSSSSTAVIPTPRMNIQLTKEQQAEIYKSMEYDEIALGATIEMPTHYVANVFEVQIDAVIFTIIGNRGPHENPLIKSHLNNINFKLSQRAQGFKLELDLESFNVLDNNNNNTLFPYVVTSNPKYKRNQQQQTTSSTITTTTGGNNTAMGVKDNTNLFHIIFESKPIESTYDYALSLMLKSLEIIINKQQIERLVEFATPKENVNLFSLSSAALEEFILLKEMTIFQLREVVNHHKTIDLYIDAKAPILIIPEHYTTENITNDTNLIILDLGNFTMQSDISKKPRKQHGAHLETPFIINEQITKLTELNDGDDDDEQDDKDKAAATVLPEQQSTATVASPATATTTAATTTEEDEDDLKISDLYDHYRASLSSIKVLLATHNQDWYIPDDDNVKGYQLIEEMSINLHIQSCIEPNELSLSLFKVSGVLPQVKMNLSDTSYLRLYRVAKTLGTIHSSTATTTTITAYNHIMDIYSNTQDTFVQQVDAKTTEIKLSDAYKQVLSKRKIFDAKFKLEKVLINVISNSGGSSGGNGNKLLQLRISELQVSLKKKTYDYNGSLLLGSLEVEDCQETSERFNCLITSQSRFGQQQPTTSTTSTTTTFDKSLISIHTEMIDRESPHYNQVDTMIDFSFGELNFNYNPKSMGKIICFLDYCFEETFKIQDQFIGIGIDNNSSALSNIFQLSSTSSTPINESPLLESNNLKSTTSIKPPQSSSSSQQPQQQQYNGGSIIKAKASIYSLSISLNEQGRELGRFSINEFAIEECTISGRSLSVSGYLESISIDSFLDHPTEGFKILTRKNSGVSMAKFKYSTFDNNHGNISKKQQSNSTSSLPQLPSSEFDKEIELYLCGIRLTVLVDFILKTKHLIELPFKTVKYDSLYKYQLQQQQQQQQAQQQTTAEQQDETSGQFDLQAATTSTVKVININDGQLQQPIGWKPLKINYKIFLESPQIILSSSDDIHSNHDRIIAELGSIDIKTTLIKSYHSIGDEQVEIQWESIQANLYDMNVRTFKNGIYHQVLHNLSIYNQIDTVLCDGDNRYISFQKYPNQKKINVIVKEIKIEFIDLEHSLILSLTKDVISRITNGLTSNSANGVIIGGKSISLPGSSSNSLSSSSVLLPPPPPLSSSLTTTTIQPTTTNPLSSSSSSILFVNSDKEYSTTLINVGIDKFQLILKLDDQEEQQQQQLNDFVTIELEKISINMESCKKNDTNTNITIDDLILYDDRKQSNSIIVNKFSKIVEKKKNCNDGNPPFISVKFINYKDNHDWESSVFIEIQPATVVLSLGLILGIKDFFLLPFVTTLTSDQQIQFENDPESIDIPTLSKVLQDIKSAAIDAIVGGTKKSLSTKLQLSLIAKHPQVILPVSNVYSKFITLDINGIVSLTNSFSPMLIKSDGGGDDEEFDFESMEIKLDQLKLNVYEINDHVDQLSTSTMVYNDIKLLYPITTNDNSGFNIVVNYSSFDSIYTNTIETLTCGIQPTVVDVIIDKLSITVTEEQYQFFCDMISQLLRSLDNVPNLKLKKRNPYMLNVLLAQQQKEGIHNKILEIFGMKVTCKFDQVDIQLLSNDGKGIEFSKLVLDNVDLSIDMATENRPKKMLIEGTVDELSVYDCRQQQQSPFYKVLERYSKSSPMMEFSQTMYQSNSPLFPTGQLYSSLLNFKLSHLKSFALPSFSLRVWDWVVVTITSIFSTYTIDKYIQLVYGKDVIADIPSSNDEGTINRMKMNVNIPLPLIIIPSAKDSTVTIEVRPNDIQISNEFILKSGGVNEYSDVMNIILNSLDMNLLTHNGITESNISRGSKLLATMENFITEEQHEQHDGDIITNTLNNSKFTIKSIDSINTGPFEFKFNQTQYNHFYNCINNALKYHYEMDSIENQIFSKPNNQSKQIDNIITLVQFDSIKLNLLDQDNEQIDDSCLAMIKIDDLNLENIISSTNETMQVIGLIGNLIVEDTLNSITIIQPISTDKFFTMFKYKTYTRSLNCIKYRQSLSSPSLLSSSITSLKQSTISTTVIQNPDLFWDTEFEFCMKSVQFNLSLSNLNIPLLIQPFLLTILEKYPIEQRPKSIEQIQSLQLQSNAPLKMKIDISLLLSKLNVSDSKLSMDKMIISFDEISMKHQANQLNKIDDIGTLIMDIESIKYKISSISVEIILAANKPYFLLSDINISASQRTIRNHLDIINKLYFDNGGHSSNNNQESTDPFESLLNSDGGLSDCFKNQELISKSKTSIHSNATQIDLHSNHYQFLLNLYNSINSKSIGIGKSDDEDIIKSTNSTSGRKEYLLNFIEFQLKDCSINLINKYNNIILNVQMKQMESYIRQIECNSFDTTPPITILKMDGSIFNLQISDQRRESCLLSEYQNLISNYGNDGNSNNNNHSNSYDHVHNKFNQLKFTFKPYVYNENDNDEANLLFNSNNSGNNSLGGIGTKNCTVKEYKDKWNNHLILSLSNSQITPIFDLFTEIKDNFLPPPQTTTSSPVVSRTKIELSMESNQFILPINFEIAGNYLRCEIKKMLISNDYQLESISNTPSSSSTSTYESNTVFLDINGFSMDCIMSVLLDSNQPRVNRIIRDSNINIITKMIDWESIIQQSLNSTGIQLIKPHSVPSIDTDLNIEYIDFLFCLEEYKFMYDTLNSTLKRYYDFKFLPLPPIPTTPLPTPSFNELISIENKVSCIIQSFTMNMIKRSKPNIKESTIKPIGQIYCKKLVMSIDICKLNMKLQGSIGSMFIRSIKTKDNKNSLYLDILKPKLIFDSYSDDDSDGNGQLGGDDDKLIKFEYISHSEPVSITNDQSTVRVKWDTQYSVDIGSINLVSKISTLLKIKDFIMEPLSTPFVQPPSNNNNKDSNYKPKMYQILRMKPWTLEIPQSEQSTEMISIEFGSISMINFYRLFHSNGVTLNKQIEVLSIDITQFTMYTQRDILQTMVSNSPSCQMEVERLFTLNDRSLEDLKTRCKISSFELIFSAEDYQFLYTIFTGNWMFNDLEEIDQLKPPIPPSVPHWNDRSHKFQFIPLEHQEQIKISENQFSSSNGFINVLSNPLQTFTLKIDTFNFHMNPILDPLAILVMNQVSMDYTLYRDGIMKTNMNLKDVLLLDERKNTSCVFKEILTRKQTITYQNQPSSSSQQPPPHIIIDYLMDPNRNRQFTSIQLDHPMLFVSPNSILPILDFFTSLQQPVVEPVDKSSSSSVNNNKSPAHIRFYLKVTKPKLLLVEDETQQNTNALVMKMPIEFHFSKTSELNQTMELHASKCQLFRTTPFSDSNNGATSTPITNSFAFNCIYIQFNENEQTTIQIRFQPLNICLSYKEILMINRLLNNLSLSNYKEQQLLKQQQQLNQDNDEDNDENKDDGNQDDSSSNIRRNHSIPQFDDEDDEVRIQKGYRELEKKKKERKELSKSKSLVAPDRPDQSGNLMHKTRVSVEFLGRVSFTLLDESVTMKDIPFVQMNIGEFQSDYWGWEEYSFLSCDMFLKVEVFNQKHMAFDSLVEQFQLNLQILQSEDPKLKISVKSNSPVNINISQPFIQALANFYQNILKTNSLLNNSNNNINSPDIIIDHHHHHNDINIGNGSKIINGNGITIGGRRNESAAELISFENVEPEDILFNGLSSPSLLSSSVSTPSLFQHTTTTTTTTTTTSTTSNSFINGNISPTNNSNNNSGIGIGGTRKPTIISKHQRNQSIGETSTFNVSTSPGWKKPLNSGYLQQVDYYSKNSLSNSIINSKVRDMRSSVNLSLLNKSIASHQRSTHNRKNSTTIGISGGGHSRQNSISNASLNAAQSSNLTQSLNAQTLFTTEGNNQFWIVNLTGKSIEYYVEELNFVQSYNVNDSGSGIPLPNINLNNSFNARDISSSPATSSNTFQHSYYNNSDDEEDKKISKKSLSSVLSQKEVHVLKNREKQALELNSVLFKTRDFRAHGSLNAHVAIRFIPTPNDPSSSPSTFNDSLDSNGIGSDSNTSTTGSNINESSQWIHGVSINQIGDNFYFPPFGNKANLVVCEVGWDEKNESKIATLRSPVLVKNSSNTPIDVLLISNNPNIENQLFGPVRVDENFYIPVDFWNYNSSISIRPFGKDFNFDYRETLNLCESSSWPDAHIFTSTKESVGDSINYSSASQLPSMPSQPSPHSSVNGSFNNLPKPKIENFYLGTMIQSGIRCDRTGLISTTLVVTPPIIFENVLLVDIELRIMSHNNKGRKLNDFMKNVLASKPSTTLTPGKQLPWYSNCGNDVGITLSLKGLGKDQYFHLPSFSHNSPLSTVNDSNNGNNPSSKNNNDHNPVVQSLQNQSISSLLLDSNGNSIQYVSFTQEIPFQCTPEYTNNSYTLMLKIDHRFEGGCHIASIYCTNAIQNHTMIPFLLRPSNLKLANALTLETNEDPLMLSHDKFYCYHPSSPKVASKEFDIILGKEDIIEIQFEGNGKREVDQMRFQFKAIVSTGYNVFFRTRIVDIYPRFVLVNKLPVSLSYTQVNKDIFQMVKDSQLLAPDSSIPFHWFNGKEEQQLSISIGQGTGDQSWTWSGGMKIDQIGVNFLKLRHQYDDQIEQSIKVEVRDTSESTMIYFYSNDPQNLPFHIKNESFTTISFHQKHQGAKKYTLKPMESLYFTWDYPSGERKLTVQIVCSGTGGDTIISQDINLNKIKVFKPIKLTNAQLIFPIVESFNGTTRNLLFTTSYKERKELDLLEFAFDISFSDISFSLIDDVPQELVYIAFKDFNFWTSSSNLTETTWIIIDDIQIDNQQPDTEYPVLLWCDKKKDSQALPFLEYSAVKLKKKNIKYYDLIALYLNEMYIQLDDKTLLALNNFYQKIPMDKFTKDPSDLENNSGNGGGNSPSTPIPPQSSEEPSSTPGGIPENFYIKWLIFAEIKIYLTFSISRDGILSNYNKMPALRLVVPSLGKSLGQLENAPLNINQLGIKNIFTTMSNLTQLLSSHYTKQMKRQIHVILGSSNIFGSPLVFFNNISTGMTEAIEDPIMGSIQLMKRILYAAANSSSKLFGTISSGFATWSLDETYLRKRDAEEKVKAKHIAHGFYLGSKGFAMGIIDGVFGIVEHPVRGAMNEGVFGFFKGCGKGILGIAVKPVTGVFDFASKTSEGIRNNTNIHPERFRKRTPRYINPREPIKEYSVDESEGNFLLERNSDDINKNEGSNNSNKMEYKFHVVLPDCTLLLTSHSVICLSKKGIYRWSFPLSEISKLVNVVAKCKLNIHLKNYRSFGTFSQLRKKISIHCPSDPILFQLYSKITSCFNKSNRLELEENEAQQDGNTMMIAMVSRNIS